MARTGTPTVIALSRKICKVVGRYGAADLGDRVPEGFRVAVLALVAACLAFEALDDQPGEIDSTGPVNPLDPDAPGA